jgi:glutaredoxin
MKQVLFFMLPYCPHCRRAEGYIQELLAENPAYCDADIKRIDESKEGKLARKYDYYLVPTFYVDGVKLHEGIATRDEVKKVLDAAVDEK